MKTLKLFFPGRFEDAHLYMGRLILLTENRSIRVFSLERIVAKLEQQYSDIASIPTLMFLRNDYLASEQFKLLLRNHAMAESILAALNRFPQSYAEIKDIQPDEFTLDLHSQILLDTVLYNSRLYIGADDGFFHIDLPFSNSISEIRGKPQKRLDARCVRVLAGYGAVNASCGNAGLYTALDEFGSGPKRISKTAERSLRATWLDHALINYPTYSAPELHRCSYEVPEYRSRPDDPDRKMITFIDPEAVDLAYLFESLIVKYGISREAIQYSFNSNKAVFVNTFDGQFYAIGLKHEGKTDRPTLEYAKSYNRTQNHNNTRVLSSSPVRYGEVIETEDQVLLFADKQWSVLEDSEVLSVRTFRKSKRYQNVVAITKEDGVILVSLFDEFVYMPNLIREQTFLQKVTASVNLSSATHLVKEDQAPYGLSDENSENE